MNGKNSGQKGLLMFQSVFRKIQSIYQLQLTHYAVICILDIMKCIPITCICVPEFSISTRSLFSVSKKGNLFLHSPVWFKRDPSLNENLGVWFYCSLQEWNTEPYCTTSSKKCLVHCWRRLNHSTIVSTCHIWKWITETHVGFSLAYPAVIQD